MAIFKRKSENSPKKTGKKAALIWVGALFAAAAFVLLLIFAIIPGIRYIYADSLLRQGAYWDSYEAFAALDGFADSAVRAHEAHLAYCKDTIRNAKVGSKVVLGSYEQDNDPATAPEDITWLVLAKEDGKVLVISELSLDCKQYGTDFYAVTWENSLVRSWLNSTFLATAFTVDEAALISTATLANDPNPYYGTEAGNATQDQVFLLSIQEAEQYFADDSARYCKPTAYSVVQGTSSSGDGCWWWLRSPGYAQINATIVDRSGVISSYGIYTFYGNAGIRPAMWLDLNEISQTVRGIL